MKIKEIYRAVEANIKSITISLEDKGDFRIDKLDITEFNEQDRMTSKEIQYKFYIEDQVWRLNNKFEPLYHMTEFTADILEQMEEYSRTGNCPEELAYILQILSELVQIIRKNPNFFLFQKQTALQLQLVNHYIGEYKDYHFEIFNFYNEAQSLYDIEETNDVDKQIFITKKSGEPIMSIDYSDNEPYNIRFCDQDLDISPFDMILNFEQKKIPLTIRELYKDIVELDKDIHPDNERLAKLRNKHLNFLNTFRKEKENGVQELKVVLEGKVQ